MLRPAESTKWQGTDFLPFYRARIVRVKIRQPIGEMSQTVVLYAGRKIAKWLKTGIRCVWHD
jgi:hypothetical protein